MNNRYNYYPSNNYNRMNYNEFMNSLGIDNNMNVNLVQNNLNNNNKIFGPYEGYLKGNLFKNMYDEYKDYQPSKLVPNSEEAEALLNLNQVHFAMHEANLLLDVYPDDNNILSDYIRFRDNYNELLDNYQKKYEALNVNSDSLNQIPFGWEDDTWPWDRRGL